MATNNDKTNALRTAKAVGSGRMVRHQPPVSCNNGFWGRDPEERASRMDAACERGGTSNFFDLPPEERAACYDA